jgi:methionine synthase I (cobalamin-dependent)
MRCESELRDEQANAAYKRGMKLARRVADEFETRNPRTIAERVGVQVAYLRWPLVTVGEFDSKNSTINVNLNAIKCAKQDTDRWFSADALLDAIVAHELGHFFALQEGQKSGENDRAMDEVVAHSFTETLLELPFSSHEYEGLWRN